MLFLLLVLRVLALRVLTWRADSSQHQFRRTPRTNNGGDPALSSTDYKIGNTRFQPKPPWVLREVIRLKALMPADTGCRGIAEQFNRLHGGKPDGETVGRTWVSEHLKKHRYSVLQLRRRLKHSKPKPMPAHRIWAMDMTGLRDQNRKSQTVLGIIDHGSRWLLSLGRLRTKTSIALLRALLDAIEAHDLAKPDRLRTDNKREPEWFEAWNGRLAGYWFAPG